MERDRLHRVAAQLDHVALLNVAIMWLRCLCNIYQGREGGRRQLCMTRTGRHFLNLGCLKEGGGYNYLGGVIG